MVEGARRSGSGFTLVELMVAVAIIGVLASIAIPSFTKYIRQTQSMEASTNLGKLLDAARAYYLTERADTAGVMLPRQFPPDSGVSGGWTPFLGVCCASVGKKCAPNPSQWQRADWQALNFAIDDSHYYSYYVQRASGDGSQAGHRLRLWAVADLDCDHIYQIRQLHATVSTDATLGAVRAVYALNELE